MINEEAIVFLDNLKICINEHPIVADWLVEIADRKTENSSEKPNNCKPQTNRIADKKPTPIRDFMVNGKVKDEPQMERSK